MNVAAEEEVAAQPAGNGDQQQNDVCEVCLVTPRDTRFALVPCGHQRFCLGCVEQVEQQHLRCPLCRMHGYPDGAAFVLTVSLD